MLVRNCKICTKKFFVKFKSSQNTCCSKECRTVVKSLQLKTHGASKTKLYSIWCGIKNRCNSATGYVGEMYGLRGITICNDWNNSFDNFRTWAKKSGYRPNLEIDRKNNNKGYCPSNCRWVTKNQQNYNKRKRRAKCSSIYKGVSLIRSGVWRLQFSINGKNTYCGSFRDEVIAAKEYDKLAVKYFGKHACLNFSKAQGGVKS